MSAWNHGRASWEFFFGGGAFSCPTLSEFVMGSMYRTFIDNHKQDLTLEKRKKIMYLYSIFLAECFVTMATGFALFYLA